MSKDCKCDNCKCGWDKYRDDCQNKFEFDDNFCAHPDADMVKCEEHVCPLFKRY